jgi:rhomboid family GlyGly-CTERM serine protease
MKTTLALTMAALAAALVDGSMLELQRGGDVWRIVTGHFTHWTYEQLAWDVLAFLCLGVGCERRDRKAYHATLLASIVLVPVAVLLFDPGIVAYRGLSGIDSALFAMLVVSTRNVFLGVLFAGKIAFEAITGGAVFANGGYEVVPVAHIAGALIGAVIALCVALLPACRGEGGAQRRMRGSSSRDAWPLTRSFGPPSPREAGRGATGVTGSATTPPPASASAPAGCRG